MPLYPDHYYGTLAGVPSYGQSSLYQSITGYNRAMAPPSGIITRSNLVSHNRYTPMLTPISESALHNIRRPLTRINSPLSPGKMSGTSKYIAPRPIPINTADIDVSASRFRDRRRDKEIILPKKIEVPVYGSGEVNGTSQDGADDKPCRINRNRSVVRLSTIRSRSKSRSDDKKKPSEKDEIMEKIKAGLRNPEVLEKKSKTTWREKFGDELNTKYRDPPAKSPGELLREKHLIKEKEAEEAGDNSPVVRRRSIKKRGTKKLPSFHAICRDISSDKINDDLNANELRGLPTLSIEEHEQHLLQKIRRLSSGNIGVLEEPGVSLIKEEPNSDAVEPVQTVPLKMRNKITSTVDIENVSPKLSFDVEVDPMDTIKPIKFNAVVEAEDHTVHKVMKLPAKRLKKVSESKSHVISLREQNDDSEDFWGAIGSRETVYLKNRKQKLLEKQSPVDFEPTNEEENVIFTKADEQNSSQTTQIETPVLNNIKSEPPKVKPIKIKKIIKTIDSPKLFAKSKQLEPVKFIQAVIEEIKCESPPPPSLPSTPQQVESSSSPPTPPPPSQLPLENTAPATQTAMSIEPHPKNVIKEITTAETSKSNETKDDHRAAENDKQVTAPTKQWKPKPKIKPINSKLPAKSAEPATAAQKQEEIKPESTNDGNKITNDHDREPQAINKIDTDSSNLSGTLSKFPTLRNLNDLPIESISSELKSIEIDTQLQVDNKKSQITDQLEEKTPEPPLTVEETVEIDANQDEETSDQPPSEMANKKKIVKRKKSKPSGNVSHKESPKSFGASDENNNDGPLSDIKSAEPTDPQSDETKKSEVKKVFDPSKCMRFDSKRVKFYKVDEPMLRPVVARPRPLQKKKVYSSSDSSDGSTPSEGEESTESENSSDGSFECASPGMSTCSVDSGFVGGTAAMSPKKMLDVKEARDSPSTPPSHNPAYRIDSNHSDKKSSYTYAQFQKSGRITAPATVIPRFRKYCVDDFHFLAVLGKGSFGKVLLTELKNTEYYYAVKCLKKDVVLEDDDVECTLIERKVLALGTNHPYLCHLFCTFQTESHLFFVMEYLNGGDLMFHIQQSGRFTEPRAKFYAAEIISGLKFLHKKGIVYRDLKLDNVLLDFDGHVRIADFGMCKLQIYLDKTADSFCGTPDYMAPEIIRGQKYNQTVDWWSFGVLLYEMLIGQSPFSGMDEDELFWSICNEIPWFPIYLTEEALNIVKALLDKDSSVRLGAQFCTLGDITEQPFFRSIHWDRLEARALEPPFKPQVRHPLDTQYFDKAFTKECVRLTPIDKAILESMDQQQFQGFSYTNPNATLT